MDGWQWLYRQEAQTLGRIGAALRDVELPTVTARLQRALADQAIAAWQRHHEEGGHQQSEDCQQRLDRQRAGTLALIGLCLTERAHGEQVVVDLDADLVARAIDAADDLPRDRAPGGEERLRPDHG